MLNQFHFRITMPLIACPDCGKTQHMGQRAAKCVHSGILIAQYKCRACGFFFKLPVKPFNLSDYLPMRG